MLVRILVGLAMMFIGFHMVWKTDAWLRLFGRNWWAERHFGVEGGSRLFYKLLGVAVTFLGLFVATNMIQGIIVSIFGPLFSSL